MAFTTTAAVEGSTVFTKVHPSAKRYTLKDNGFTETKSGNFQLIRSLDPTPQRNEGFKLKITITADLKRVENVHYNGKWFKTNEYFQRMNNMK